MRTENKIASSMSLPLTAPTFIPDLIDFVHIEDLDNFALAMRMSGEQVNALWRRRFALQQNLPEQNISLLEIEHQIRYVFGTAHKLDIPYRDMALTNKPSILNRPLSRKLVVDQALKKTINQLYPNFDANRFDVPVLNLCCYDTTLNIGMAQLSPPYGKGLKELHRAIEMDWRPLEMGFLNSPYKERKKHLAMIKSYSEQNFLQKTLSFLNLPSENALSSNLDHIDFITNQLLSSAEQRIALFKNTYRSFQNCALNPNAEFEGLQETIDIPSFTRTYLAYNDINYEPWH